MEVMTTYKVKIKESHGALKATVNLYRQAVDFFIDVSIKEWDIVEKIEQPLKKQRAIECLVHYTNTNPNPKYNFDQIFGKFPSYLRRAAISEAIGKVSSYKSNYANWEKTKIGNEPGYPKAGCVYPAMYRDNCFVRTGTYEARLKVWISNTWDWINIKLKKTDVDYILRNCANRRECVPTLRRRGKNWYLDFAFKEKIKFENKGIKEQVTIGVDLGINNACTCVAMLSDGTVIGRKFLRLPREKDSLGHKLNKIKKAQQNGAYKMPRLWAKVKGVNLSIAHKTANFIVDVAKLYCADIVVFEHLDLQGKKRGSKKQRLHHWKVQAVQQIVSCKAYREGIRVSRVCAWNTSSLAFDGSGKVERDKDNYSMCTFASGKRYNCDLSASYNICARDLEILACEGEVGHGGKSSCVFQENHLHLSHIN